MSPSPLSLSYRNNKYPSGTTLGIRRGGKGLSGVLGNGFVGNGFNAVGGAGGGGLGFEVSVSPLRERDREDVGDGCGVVGALDVCSGRDLI